jgi:BirA family transcriptional regulator, biotin operon repressor / biotin---[acetyl-CoA-carboxylase] ligase
MTFPSWLHYLDSCPSTNTWVLNRIAVDRDSLKHGDVIFTRQQTAGRGQQGRGWFSNRGVLTASFYLDRLPAPHLPYLSLLAGLAVIYGVEDASTDLRDKLCLKWTNDVMLGGGKLAGILCEAITEGKESRVVVGVGINLGVDFTEADIRDFSIVNPVSIHQFATAPDEFILLDKIRHYLLELSGLIALEKNPLVAFLTELNKRDFLRDRSIEFQTKDREYLGIAKGIGDRGELLVLLSDDRLHSFSSGRVLSWN